MKRSLSLLLILTMLFMSLTFTGCEIKWHFAKDDEIVEEVHGKLMINGNYADDYSIVCSDEFKEPAIKLAYFLSVLNGEVMPIVEEGKQTSTYAIKFIKYDMADEKVLEYNYKSSEGNILFYVALKDAESAVNQFIETYTPEKTAEKYSIRVDEPHVELLSDYDFNGLQFQEIEKMETVAPGVVYYEYLYKRADGFPVRAHIIVAEPGSVKVESGTPNAADGIDGTFQTVAGQVKAAEEKYGYDVVAACNADFFTMGEAKSRPRGVTIKNGVVIYEGEAGYYDVFAVMKDGSYFVGDPRDVKYEDVWQMVGGRYTILDEGHIICKNAEEDFITTQHPRTMLGYREDGTLVMVVVDGRQVKISNGASFHDMGQILLELGCYEAINLDGGGSSTLYTDTVKNSPSDKSERKVGNSVLFIKNENYQKE